MNGVGAIGIHVGAITCLVGAITTHVGAKGAKGAMGAIGNRATYFLVNFTSAPFTESAT